MIEIEDVVSIQSVEAYLCPEEILIYLFLSHLGVTLVRSKYQIMIHG